MERSRYEKKQFIVLSNEYYTRMFIREYRRSHHEKESFLISPHSDQLPSWNIFEGPSHGDDKTIIPIVYTTTRHGASATHRLPDHLHSKLCKIADSFIKLTLGRFFFWKSWLLYLPQPLEILSYKPERWREKHCIYSSIAMWDLKWLSKTVNVQQLRHSFVAVTKI